MSLAIGIRYLTGYAVATDVASRDQAEWPPHPARVFMSLVAAHWQSGGGDEERQALLWLEQQPTPALLASEADHRPPVTAYVPVNDRPTGSGLLQSAPLTRNKQPRTFPRVRPHCDTIYLLWETADDCPHLAALQALCAKVTRIGHSSSLVQAWVADTAEIEAVSITHGTTAAHDTAFHFWSPSEDSSPSENSGVQLRVASEGLFDQLVVADKQGRRPTIGMAATYRRYGSADPAVPQTIWSPQLIVRRLEPTGDCRHLRLDLSSTLQVAAIMHKAVIRAAHQELGLEPVPEWISGHRADRSPTEQPHLAYFPLAFVGEQYATGHLLGLAAAVPADLDADSRHIAYAAIGAVQELRLGRLGRWRLATDTQGKANLKAGLWTRPEHGATRWATVTPFVFDQHPKSKDRVSHHLELAEMVAAACERIGLPRPSRVRIGNVSAFRAAPPAHVFPRLQRKDGSQRRHTHVVLYFDQRVRGPVAIGAGRYRGYGFCRPLR
jgi:CRISPR-associated protein Csb2